MLFNSLSFSFFFPIVCLIYFVSPHRWRWIVLLISSCIFYMAFIPVYILVLFSTIVVDYLAGRWIEKSIGPRRKVYLIVSIVFTCLILFIFKYFNFFNANMKALADLLHWNYSLDALKLILPIGLSFHTFQSLSYVIEVYQGRFKAEHHFGRYALYVMFFPQLVAGPIERPQNLLPQIYNNVSIDYDRITSGLKLMAFGFFKKVVIADRLSVVVNQVYNNVTEYTGISLIIATIFFAIQIYCDFSGYSDIARGSARVLGFDLMINFKQPYFARSIPEFWQRWHISLSTWFRDYVYIPLGGNRVTSLNWAINILIVFFISGFWHGANWTFVIWGLLHGFYYLCSRWTEKFRKKVLSFFGASFVNSIFHRAIQIFITSSLVIFAWIFFRANSLGDAFYLSRHLFEIRLPLNKLHLGLEKPDLILSFVLIIFLLLFEFFQKRELIGQFLRRQTAFIRWIIYYALIWSIIVFGKYINSPFIYFQF